MSDFSSNKRKGLWTRENDRKLAKQPKLETIIKTDEIVKEFIEFEPVKIMTYKSYSGGVFIIAHGYKVTPTAETNIILKGCLGAEAAYKLILAQSTRRPTRVAIASAEIPLQPYEDASKKAFKLL